MGGGSYTSFHAKPPLKSQGNSVTVLFDICFSWKLCPFRSLRSPLCCVDLSEYFMRQSDFSSHLYTSLTSSASEFSNSHNSFSSLHQLYILCVTHPVIPPNGHLQFINSFSTFLQVKTCLLYVRHVLGTRNIVEKKTSLCHNETYSLVRR